MNKKLYITPATVIVETQIEALMEIGSATLDSGQVIESPNSIGSREDSWDLWED